MFTVCKISQENIYWPAILHNVIHDAFKESAAIKIKNKTQTKYTVDEM